MSRVVVDANVYLSALIRPQGPPGQILKRLLGERAHTIIVSKAILEEVRRSLDYPKVRKKLDATDEELDAWVDSIGVLADVPGVAESGWAPTSRKPEKPFQVRARRRVLRHSVSGFERARHPGSRRFEP